MPISKSFFVIYSHSSIPMLFQTCLVFKESHGKDSDKYWFPKTVYFCLFVYLF